MIRMGISPYTLLEDFGLLDDARVPAPAGKGGMEYHAVALVVFDVLDDALDLGKEPGRLRALSYQWVQNFTHLQAMRSRGSFVLGRSSRSIFSALR